MKNTNNNFIKYSFINNTLPWLIPLLMAILLGGYNLYSLIHRVDVLEYQSETEGKEAIKQLDNVDARVRRLEEFCCGEIVRYKEFIEKKSEVCEEK